MGRKVFVSYKYGDTSVAALPGVQVTRVRDYVDRFQSLLDKEDQINKGEADGEDLSDFKDETIESKLRDKIYDSSVTVVFISKGMKDSFLSEKDQWIPWEVAYSLREQTRAGRTSHTNAVLAVVLPDEFGSYAHFIQEDTCPHCHSRTLMTASLFQILRDNMFNTKKPQYVDCTDHYGSYKPQRGHHSYIHAVKWGDFQADIVKYLGIAAEIRDHIDDYEVVKQVK